MNAGDRLGKYQLRRRLGGGAMGVVWAAVNESTNKEVALKLLPSPDEELRRRLLREAKACGRLDHRNIVSIYDTGTTPEGEPFLVMQLLSGETLGKRLKGGGRLAPEIAAGIGAAIAAGLSAAHAENIVHRDLKPDNVFLHREAGSAGEVVKILDFGVSRIDLAGDAGRTATGMLIGSPAYMSPEQARGSRLDPRSDIWALGVVLFEMLTGARPFPSATIADAMVGVLTAPIPEVTSLSPGVSPALSAIVTACLTRDLEQRPAHARDVAAWLLPHARTAGGQPGRVELPSLGGIAHLESTELLEIGPRATTSGTLLMPAGEDEDDRRNTVPVPLPGQTMLVEAPTAPLPALPEPPPPALESLPAAISPSTAASSSTTALTRGEAQPAVPSPRRPTRAAPLVLGGLGALALVAVMAGAIVTRTRHAAPEASGKTAPTASAEGPVAPPTGTVTSVPQPPPGEPEPAPDPSAPTGGGVTPSAPSRSTMGMLTLNSLPISRVVVDGRPFGWTPKLNVPVPAGPHTVMFVYSESERHTKTISVLPGTTEVVKDRLLGAPAPAVSGGGF